MVPSTLVSLKEAALGPPKRKQVALSTENSYVHKKSIVNDEEEKDHAEKEEALAMPTIKPNKQKHAKK